MKKFLHFIFIILMFISYSVKSQESILYEYKYLDFFKKSESTFFVRWDNNNNNNITVNSFDILEGDTLFNVEENIVINDSSYVLNNAIILFKNKSNKRKCYSSLFSLNQIDSVQICFLHENIDTIIDGQHIKCNIYEILSQDYIPNDHNIRIIYDIERNIVFEKEYFQDEYIYGKEYLYKQLCPAK